MLAVMYYSESISCPSFTTGNNVTVVSLSFTMLHVKHRSAGGHLYLMKATQCDWAVFIAQVIDNATRQTAYCTY